LPLLPISSPSWFEPSPRRKSMTAFAATLPMPCGVERSVVRSSGSYPIRFISEAIHCASSGWTKSSARYAA